MTLEEDLRIEGTKEKYIIGFVVILISVIIFGWLANYSAEISEGHSLQRNSTSSSSDNFIGDIDANDTISIGDGLVSSSASIKNQTWLDFDGVNDVLTINDNGYVTVAFWYDNTTTSDWVLYVNTSGILYVDGNEIGAFPVNFYYSDGSKYYFGKEDATTFKNGSIDNIRFYNSTINETVIDALYNAEKNAR